MDKIFVVFLFAAVLGLQYSMAQDDQLDLEEFSEIAKRPNMVTGGRNRPTGKKRSSLRINGRLERLIASLISEQLQRQTAWKLKTDVVKIISAK